MSKDKYADWLHWYWIEIGENTHGKDLPRADLVISIYGAWIWPLFYVEE